ncbi:MAG: PASTA domain-containing protein, partial [Actinomycetota bacterium]
VAIAYKHVKEDPILPSRLNADIPPALEAIAMKALAKNPDNRYQNAQEMRQDLMRAASGKPVTATPVMAPIEETSIHQPSATDSTVVMRRTGAIPPPEARRRRRTGWILLALIMLAIAGVVTWAILSALNKAPETFAIPSVVGQKEEEAVQSLEAAGFTNIDVDHVESDTVAAGLVIDQNPESGEHPKDTLVRLRVSSGRGLTAVPALKGKTIAEATKLLTDAGLELGRQTPVVSSEQDKGKVIGSNPGSGVEVRRGTKVNVSVGKGPDTAPVPTVLGEDVATATAELKAAGFEVRQESRSTGSCFFAPPNTVCDQDPDGGTQAKKGSTVTIYTNSEESPSPTPTET